MTLRAPISDSPIIAGDPENDVDQQWLYSTVLTDPDHPGVEWNCSLTVVTVNYRSYLEEGKGSFSS